MKSTIRAKSVRHDGAINTEAECKLLDSIRSGFNIPTDAALAAWLGIDKSMISSVRAGTRKLGLLQRLKVLDRVGFLKTRTFVESLLPERLAHDLVLLNQRMASQQIDQELARLDAQNENVKLIEAAKLSLQLKTDAELAHVLEVGDTTISMVRSNKSGLGLLPKLRLLERVTSEFQFQSLVDFLESSSQLADAIDRWAKTGHRLTIL